MPGFDLTNYIGKSVIGFHTVVCLQRRRWQREFIDIPALLPDPSYSIEMQAPMAYRESSAYSVATKFVRSATNKMKCPVYKVWHHDQNFFSWVKLLKTL